MGEEGKLEDRQTEVGRHRIELVVRSQLDMLIYSDFFFFSTRILPPPFFFLDMLLPNSRLTGLMVANSCSYTHYIASSTITAKLQTFTRGGGIEKERKEKKKKRGPAFPITNAHLPNSISLFCPFLLLLLCSCSCASCIYLTSFLSFFFFLFLQKRGQIHAYCTPSHCVLYVLFFYYCC